MFHRSSGGIYRNIAAGPLQSDTALRKEPPLEIPTIEFSYKNDALGDPLINTYHAIALKLATEAEIETIKKYAFEINRQLQALWKECGVTLVDFKLEFGKTSDGTVVLADETAGYLPSVGFRNGRKTG